jgi:DNA repair protein RadC
MKIKDLPENERPREKLLEKGARYLSDEELLAVILGKGTQKLDVLALAKKIINIIDEKGIELEAVKLQEIEGIGAAKSALIEAAFEFVRRRIKPEGLKIKNPEDVLPLVRHYADRKQEHFIVVSLNGANEVLNVRVVTKGLVNRTQVHPREVFADVIADRACAVIIAHNHTSTNLKPSEDDLIVTNRLVEAGKILGIQILDHLIFNHKSVFSIFRDE